MQRMLVHVSRRQKQLYVREVLRKRKRKRMKRKSIRGDSLKLDEQEEKEEEKEDEKQEKQCLISTCRITPLSSRLCFLAVMTK